MFQQFGSDKSGFEAAGQMNKVTRTKQKKQKTKNPKRQSCINKLDMNIINHKFKIPQFYIPMNNYVKRKMFSNAFVIIGGPQ